MPKMLFNYTLFLLATAVGCASAFTPHYVDMPKGTHCGYGSPVNINENIPLEYQSPNESPALGIFGTRVRDRNGKYRQDSLTGVYLAKCKAACMTRRFTQQCAGFLWRPISSGRGTCYFKSDIQDRRPSSLGNRNENCYAKVTHAQRYAERLNTDCSMGSAYRVPMNLGASFSNYPTPITGRTDGAKIARYGMQRALKWCTVTKACKTVMHGPTDRNGNNVGLTNWWFKKNGESDTKFVAPFNPNWDSNFDISPRTCYTKQGEFATLEAGVNAVESNDAMDIDAEGAVQQEGSSSEPSGSDNNITLYAAVGGAVLLLAVLVAFVATKNRQKTNEAAEDVARMSRQPPQPTAV